jgi:uncharacterized protein
MTEAGIPCTVLARYLHDHLLIPAEQAEEAMAAIRRLGSGS